MKLTFRREWVEPGYTPASLYEAPFEEMTTRPVFDLHVDGPIDTTTLSLEEFADDLLGVVRAKIATLSGPVHLALSGGYDSRILAALLEQAGKEPLYITDGEEEPVCGAVLDALGVPVARRYLHDLDRADPYGITDGEIDGFAPLYSCMRFFPDGAGATLVTGLGGGEWFSYPAASWFGSRIPRPVRRPLGTLARHVPAVLAPAAVVGERLPRRAESLRLGRLRRRRRALPSGVARPRRSLLGPRRSPGGHA